MKGLGAAVLVIVVLGTVWSSQSMAVDAQLVEKIGTSAHMIGIGNIEGFDTSAASVFENPASLYRMKSNSVSAFSTTIMDDFKYLNFAVGTSTALGRVAIGVMQLGTDDIPFTSRNSFNEVESTSSFWYRNVVVKAGHEFGVNKHFHFGTAINYFYNEIYTTRASGMGLNLGFFADYGITQYSLSIKNIELKRLTYNNGQTETLPLQAVFSAKGALGQMNVYGQALVLVNQKAVLKSIGLKNPLITGPFSFYFSGGIREFMAMESTKYKITLGLGLEFGSANFYLAYDRSDYYLQDNKYYYSMAFAF
jgi:hypothetical protein